MSDFEFFIKILLTLSSHRKTYIDREDSSLICVSDFLSKILMEARSLFQPWDIFVLLLLTSVLFGSQFYTQFSNLPLFCEILHL